MALNENEPISENGYKIGYTIVNKKNKSVKGEDYHRYEIEFIVTNKAALIKLLL